MTENDNCTHYIITVDATKASPDTHHTQDLEYTRTICGRDASADDNGCQAHRLHVTSDDTVAWKLIPKQPSNPENVHLFILFPPGKSPFDDDAFHTTGSSTDGTPAATVKFASAPVEFEYYVAVIDETVPCNPVVYSDDPVIAHSGSGGIDQTLRFLKEAQQAAGTIQPPAEAAKIQEGIQELIKGLPGFTVISRRSRG